MDHLEQLERLAKLRAEGALTEAEFAAEKAALMGRAKAPAAAVAPAGSSATKPKKRRPWLKIFAVLLVAAGALNLWAEQSNEAQRKAVVTETSRVRDAQQSLADLGFKPGASDGVWGGASSAALDAWAAGKGLAPPHGVLTNALADAVIVEANFDRCRRRALDYAARQVLVNLDPQPGAVRAAMVPLQWEALGPRGQQALTQTLACIGRGGDSSNPTTVEIGNALTGGSIVTFSDFDLR